MAYSKEQMKQMSSKELKALYEEMLAEEKAKLDKVNVQWYMLREDMLKAIAKYDVATKGGKKADLNTLNVEIITKMEQFRTCDEDPIRSTKAEEIEGAIKALEFLIERI